MTASERCKGMNLLNHCKQVNKPEGMTYNYKFDNVTRLWIASIEFNNSVYQNHSTQKRLALLGLIEEIEPILREHL